MTDIAFNDRTLEAGDRISVSINDTVYSATAAVNGEDFATLIGKLRDAINADSNLSVTASLAAAPRSLVLTADQINEGFMVSAVMLQDASQAASSHSAGASELLQAAGVSATQVSKLVFTGSPAVGQLFGIVAGTQDLTPVEVGKNGVTADWASVLTALAARATSGGEVTASVNVAEKSITLTAVSANEVVRVGADARRADAASKIDILGDYVLIIPSRTVAADVSYSASGNLSVVQLPTNDGENITLKAGESLVVVSDIDVDPTGTVTVSAEKSLTLGGTVRAASLVVQKAGDDLSLTTAVSTLSVNLLGAGSDFTLDQTGNLRISSLAMQGGNINIEVDGDLTIDALTGSVGDISIVVRNGNLTIGGTMVATAGRVSLSVLQGSVTATLHATDLDVHARDAITITEFDMLNVSQLASDGGGSVSVTAGGNLLVDKAVRAVGAATVSLVSTGGSLELTQAVDAADGAVTVRAADGLILGALADITTTGGNITLAAGTGVLEMTSETYVNAGSGALEVTAGGSIRLGKLRSSSAADVVVTAGGVIDVGEGDTDIVAPIALLRITSSAGIGSAANPIETQVRALDLTNTGSGDVAIDEVDDLVIERVSQTTGGALQIETRHGDITVQGQGVSASGGTVSLYAGRSDLVLNAGVTSLGGSINLTAEGGDLLVAAGVNASKAGVAGGTITARAVQGDILIDPLASRWLHNGVAFEPELDWVLTHGRFTVDAASGQVTAANLSDDEVALHGIANGVLLRQAGGAFLQSAGGRISLDALGEVGQAQAGFRFSPLAMFIDAANVVATSSERANVSVVAVGAVSVGAGGNSGSRGGSTDVISLAGKQTLSSALDANGDNVAIAADDLDISAAVRSAGGMISFRTIDPTRAIVLGDLAGFTEGAMQLAGTDLGNLRDGFSQIVIGGEGSSNAVRVTSATGATVSMKDDLVFYTNGAGGEVLIGTTLEAPSLTIFGSGDTTTLSADVSTSSGNISIIDSVRIAGNRTLTAADGGIVLGGSNVHYLGGDGAASVDTLTLDARNGHVRVTGAVGGGEEGSDPFSLLQVLRATDVTFDQAIVIDGDLIIDATGIVTFNGAITLRNGGDLIIRGAQQVVLRGGVQLVGTNDGQAGDILLEADEIDLSMSEEQLRGSGMLTLRPTTLTQAIAVSSPPGVGSTGVLNLDTNEVRTLADGFRGIVIGHQGADGHALAGTGAVTLGARADLDSLTFRDSTSIYGSTILVADIGEPLAVLRLGGTDRLVLDAVNAVTLANEVEAASVRIHVSEGSVQQIDAAADGRLGEALRTLDLQVAAATGVSLKALEVHTLDVVNSGSGAIDLGVLAARGTAGFSAAQIDGSVDVLRLAQLQATDTGNLNLVTHNGAIVVTAAGSGVRSLGSGSISLQAGGEGADLRLAQAVQAAGGAITLQAADAIQTSGAGLVRASGSGAITLTAGGDVLLGSGIAAAGGLVTVTAGGALTMQDGVAITSLGGSSSDAQRVALQAGGDLTLSVVEAGASIAATSTAGAILDGLSGDAPNLKAPSARLSAATGIGSSGAPLHTQLDTLGASNSGSGGVFIAEVDALAFANGGISAAGGFSLALGQGDLVIDQNISVSAGDLRLSTVQPGADIVVRANLTAEAGSLTLDAADELRIEAGQRVQTRDAASTLTLRAGGALLMAADARSVSAGGTQRLSAGGNIVLGQVSAGSGLVALLSGGAIVDADPNAAVQTVNIASGSARIEAVSGIGSAANVIETSVNLLAAGSVTGGLYLAEGNGLTIGRIETLSGANLATSGAIVITNGNTHDGRLVVDEAIVSGGSGPVLLSANRSTSTSLGSVTLNALVDGGTGNVTVRAQGDIAQTANGDVVTRGASIDLQALGGAVQMAEGASLSSGGGVVTVQAHTNSSLGTVLSGGGDVTVQVAAGSLSMAASGLVQSQGGTLDLRAQGGALTLADGATLASGGGDILLGSRTSTTLGDLRSGGGDIHVTAQGGLNQSAGSEVLSSGGLIDLNALGGDLVMADGAMVNSAGGHLRVAVQGQAALGQLASGSGALSVVAQGGISQSAASSVFTTSGTVDLRALGGGFAQAEGAQVSSGSGNVRVAASGDVTVGRLDAGSGLLSVVAGGAITDLSDDNVDLLGQAVRLQAGGSIGSSGNALEVQTGTFSATAGGDVFLQGTGSLNLGSTAAIGVDAVAADGTLSRTGTTDAAQSGVVAGGSVHLGAATNLSFASGDLLLSAGGDVRLSAAAGDLVLGQVRTPGVVSLQASGSLVDGDAAVDVSAGQVLIDVGGVAGSALDTLELSTGELSLKASSAHVTQDGSLTLKSAQVSGGMQLTLTRGDLSLGQVDARQGSDAAKWGDVTLTVAGSVIDVAAGLSDPVDVHARTLAVQAGVAIGAAGAALQTDVQALRLQAGSGGAFVAEADALRLSASSGGTLVVQADGDLTVDGGVAVTGNGRLLLDSSAVLSVGAAVATAAGDLTLHGANGLRIDAVVGTGAAGASLLADGGAGSISFGTQGVVRAAGDVRLQAGQSIQAAVVQTPGSAVLIAGDAIVGAAGQRILADSLLMQAGHGIGSVAQRLETQVNTLTARAGAGGIWVQESDTVRIGDVSQTVRRVGADGSTSDVVQAVQSDLVTTSGNGSIGLRTLDGSILLSDGSAPADGRSVTAHGTGVISLSAGGSSAVLDTNPDDIVQQGPITIDSALRVQGTLQLVAGQAEGAGDGAITLERAVDGNAGLPLDRLVLHADGPVLVQAAIGATVPLDGLLVDGATDVRFDQAVHLAGDLVIQASGVVEFRGPLTLDGAAALRIEGASQVILNGVVLGSGSVTIQADDLQLAGVVQSAGGVLHIGTVQAGRGITVDDTGAGLLLDAAELARLSGFVQVNLGDANTGTVALDAAVLAALQTAQLNVDGNRIDVQGSGTLAAGTDLVLNSRSAIAMTADASLGTAGGDATLRAAGDIALGRIDARGASVAGGVMLVSQDGTIFDAARDELPNVQAGWLVMRGHGPLLAAGQSSTPDAIDVDAPRVDIDASGGVVMRDSGSDGSTRFNLLDGDQLYQQVQARADTTRVATGPTTGPVAVADDHAAWMAALRPLSELRSTAQSALWTDVLVSTDQALGSTAARYLASLDAGVPVRPTDLAEALSLSAWLEQAWLLGSASQQPSATGLQTMGSDRFDYWEEHLAL